ncbi:MAG: hypothetical protein ABEI58_03445 [Candidatus Nanohaloarchaea archaeon]
MGTRDSTAQSTFNPFLDLYLQTTKFWLDLWLGSLTGFRAASARDDEELVELVDEKYLMSPEKHEDGLDTELRDLMEYESMADYFWDLVEPFYSGEWRPVEGGYSFQQEMENMPQYIQEFGEWEMTFRHEGHDAGLLLRLKAEENDVYVDGLLSYDGGAERLEAAGGNPTVDDIYGLLSDAEELLD